MNICMNTIESMIQRHAPGMMRSTAVLEEDAVAAPKQRKPSARKAWRVITPEMGTTILAMYAKGDSKTDIAAHFRIGFSTVRDWIRKNNVKTSAPDQKVLREGSACGVKIVKTNLYNSKRVKH
jgi:helix-turn-helix protein